ncbi:DUF5803 family protein [Methanospirillum hungatei]|uniref:DUF5803 family protein n=1 Tax=Methanospirillum hungatei TaxID=2203 RepID=UPI002CA498BA|nr:DUF5803 family protein [Methanospirillum hungatei]HOW05234.1 DUF5803 family protein [Methanospirillum hungatei]
MRRYTRITAFCLTALILCVLPVAGITFSATVDKDGKGYSAVVLVNNTDRYELIQPGMVGERIPLETKNLTVRNETDILPLTPDRGILTFPKGNYSISYEAMVNANTMQFLFTEPANVTVSIPRPFMVTNPLLTSIQPSGSKLEEGNNTTNISWKQVRSVEIRYYDEGQEHLLYLFAQFWLIIAVVLLLPFFLSRKN